MSSLRLALKQSLQEAGGSVKQSRSNRDGGASKKKKRKGVDHSLKKGCSAKDQAATGDESDDHCGTRERGEDHEDGYGSSSAEENEFSAGEEGEEEESESHTNNDDGEDLSHSHRSHEEESSRPPSRSSNAFSGGEDHDNEEERKMNHRKLQKKLKHTAANKIQNQWKRKKESKVEDEETAEPIQSRKQVFTSTDAEEASECHSYDHPKCEARDKREHSDLQAEQKKKTGDRGSGRGKTAKTVPPPEREVLDWNRSLHPKEARRHVIQGLRVKVRFATKVKREGLIKKKKKWFGGRVAAVSKEGSKIRIKYDDGTAEISKFPDKDVVVDDNMNGEHKVSSDNEELQAKLSKFVPPALPSVVEDDEAADDDRAEDATQQNEGSKVASIEKEHPPAGKTNLREDETAKKESIDCTKSATEAKEEVTSMNCNVVTAPDDHAHADATVETRPSSPPVEGITNWQSAPAYNLPSQGEMDSKRSPASTTGSESNTKAENATSPEVKESANDLDDKLQDDSREKGPEKEKTIEKPATSKPTLKIRLPNPNKLRRAIQETYPRPSQAKKPDESSNEGDINSKNTQSGNLPGSVTEKLPSDKDESAASSKKRHLDEGQSDIFPVPPAKRIHIQKGASPEDERTSKASSSAMPQSEGEERVENAKAQSDQEKMVEDAKPQSDQEYTLEDAKKPQPYQEKIAEATKPTSYRDEASEDKKTESERRKSPDNANPQSGQEIRAGDAKPQPDAEETAVDEMKSEQVKTLDIQRRQSDFAPRKQLSHGSFTRSGRADEQGEVEDPTHPSGRNSAEHEMDLAGTEEPLAGVEDKSKMCDAKSAEEKAETLDDEKPPESETRRPIAREVSMADAAAPGTLEEIEAASCHGKDAEISSKDSAFEEKNTTALAGGDASQEKAVVVAKESSNETNNSATESKLQRRPSTPHDKFEAGSAPGVRSGRKAAQQAIERIVSKEKDGDKEKDSSTAQGKKRKKRRESDDDSGEDSKEDHNNWIQCDSCKKWRIIPNQIDIASLPERWYCHFNTYDSKRNTCEAPEETAVPIPRMKKRRGKKRVRQRAEPEAMDIDVQALSRKDSAQSQSDNATEKTRARSPFPKEDTKQKEAPPKSSSTQKPPRSSPTTLAPVEKVSVSEGSVSPSSKPEKKLSAEGGRKRLPDTPLEAIPEALPVEPKVKRSRGKKKELKEDNKVPSASAGSSAIQTDNDADNVEWVQCEKCEKWRKLPSHISADELPDVWFCQLNTWNPASASCEAPEDKADGQLDIGAFGGSTGYGGSKLSYRSLIFGSGRKVNRPISERTRAAESIFAAPVDESELAYPQVMYANSSAFAPRGSRANIIEEESNGISVFELMNHSNLWTELRGANPPVSPGSSFDSAGFISSSQTKYPFITLPSTTKQDMKDMIVRVLETRTLLPEEVHLECHSKKWDDAPASWAEIRAHCTKDLVITLLCELVTEGTVEIVQAFGAEWTIKDWNPRYRLAMTARNGNGATVSAKPSTHCMKISKPWKRTMGLT